LKFAVNVPNFGAFADARVMAELAWEAEGAGWDGFFIWDHIRPGPEPLGDPWVLLTAIALATERLRIGPMVTPVPRRRPEELARQATTLDRLSNGRLVLGVGLGDDTWREYSAFDGPEDARVRAEMLDEGLYVLTALWRGRPVTFDGRHFRIRDAEFQPLPLQQPRIPIWVAGRWPAQPPFRRAARWDGAFPVSQSGSMTPAMCRDLAELISLHRKEDGPFDIAVAGPGWPAEEASARARAFEAAGATWYQVGLAGVDDVAESLMRIRSGPPCRT
jgi:alkanesulfonate monooxygenase SsuD/methylene tetrahydromethanopterin reductase-like flavin-dependent oxidoreductase (luciferase family)